MNVQSMTRVFLPVLGAVKPVAPGADPLLDGFARRVRYLRVSVTDRCNYRCSYCMPEELGDQLIFEQKSQVLSFEELERLVGIFARLGVRKIRLTGGEPTVRRGIVDLAARLARVPGIEQLLMTANGHLLDELAAPLAAAGVQAINISIDTLDPTKFTELTGRGDLARVIRGIDATLAAGMRVKLNTVALRGVNDDELAALCAFAWDRGATPRFIEHMPMSGGQLYEAREKLTAAQIRAAIEAVHGPLVPARAAQPDAGPARYWRSHRGDVGIISAMTEHFCDDCNRLRLTATGALHACLGHDDAISLRDIMRRGGPDDDVIAAIAGAVTGKREGHLFSTQAPQKHMIGIGG